MVHLHKSDKDPSVAVLDASTSRYVIGLSADDEGISQYLALDSGVIKGENLLAVLQPMLEASGLEPRSIGIWVTTKGPGSFTGLRVVMSMLQSISAVSDAAIVCIPTLFALAAVSELPDGSPVVMKARKDHYYCYIKGDPPLQYQSIPFDKLQDMLRQEMLVGWEGPVPSSLEDYSGRIHPLALEPEALCELGKRMHTKKAFLSDVYTLVPDYAGPSVAEMRFAHSKRVGGKA